MHTRVKSKTISNGDIFLVPLKDHSFCCGQVLQVTKELMNSCICGFFDIRLSPDSSQFVPLPQERDLIAVQFVTSDLLKKGYWPIVGSGNVTIDLERYIPLQRIEARGLVGAVVEGSGIIQEFLNAYYGLRPWDDLADSDYFDKLLISRGRRPEHVVLTKRTER